MLLSQGENNTKDKGWQDPWSGRRGISSFPFYLQMRLASIFTYIKNLVFDNSNNSADKRFYGFHWGPKDT